MRRPHDDARIFGCRQQRENEFPGCVGVVPITVTAFIAVCERGFVPMMSIGDEERPVRVAADSVAWSAALARAVRRCVPPI